jgi:PAS domain S-box-containing protein
MSTELLLVAAFGVFAVFGLPRLWAPERTPLALWVSGWIAASIAGLLLVVAPELRFLHYGCYALGSLFSVFTLAGTLRWLERPATRALVAAGLALGAIRTALVGFYGPWAGHAFGLAVDPPIVLAAALLAVRGGEMMGERRTGRLLGASLFVLAVASALHLLWLAKGGGLSLSLVALWAVATPPLLGIQLETAASWSRRALERTRRELEWRVAERTQELAQAKERWRRVSELSSDLSFAFHVRGDGKIHADWVTEAFPRVTGFSLEEVQDGRWDVLVHPEDRASARAQLERALAAGSGSIVTRICHKDGRARALEIRVLAEPEADGSMRVMGAARDVTEAREAETERQRLEHQVQEAQRVESLGLLSAGIAHDFNNVLAVVLGNARLALSELPEESRLRSRMARIVVAAQHGSALTERMLVYAGRGTQARKPLRLASLIEEMDDLLHASLPESCRLETTLDADAWVEGDDTQLRQVLLNLVTNAAEARAGRVTVRTGVVEADAAYLADARGVASAAPGSWAFLEVSDTGPGMDEATRRRIFDPFFSTKATGRGLGLAATLGIVRGHGGVLKVTSEPGRGTTIRVLLPHATLGSRAERMSAGAASSRAPLRVLVIDDDEAVLELAEEFLTRAGNQVVTARGGRDGLAHFARDPGAFAAVVADLAMPDLDGRQVLEELRRLRPGVPVILATGHGSDLVASSSDHLGPVGFLRKPYGAEELVARVAEAVAGVGERP